MVSHELLGSLPLNLINKTSPTKPEYSFKQGSKLKHKLTPKIEKILALFEAEGCILAGGFLRDYILNKPFKDLDFFFKQNNQSNISYKLEEEVAEILEFDFDRDSLNTLIKSTYSSSNIKNVTTFNVDGINWQFINLHYSTINYPKKHFDYSINQVWYVNGKIHATKAFIKTLYDRQVEQYNEVTAERYLEMSSKFPEFIFPKPKQNGLLNANNLYQDNSQGTINQAAGTVTGSYYAWTWVNGTTT